MAYIDEPVHLRTAWIQSTYDNPAFQFDEYSHGPPSARYKYADDEPASITFEQGGEKKAYCCFACFIFLIILIYAGVIVGLCVYFLVALPQQRAAVEPIEHYTKLFSCEVKVVDGPFSKYSKMLQEPMSSEYLTYAGAWQFQMDQTFKSSSLSKNYDSVKVTGLKNGSVIIQFDIKLKQEVAVKESVYEDIKRVILSSCSKNMADLEKSLCVSGAFVFTRDDVKVTSTDGKTTSAPVTTAEPPSPDCLPIPNNTLFGCHDFYSHAKFPNYLGQTTMAKAKASLGSNSVLLSIDCYRLVKLFVCSILMPKCVNITVNITTTAMPTTETEQGTTAGATTAATGAAQATQTTQPTPSTHATNPTPKSQQVGGTSTAQPVTVTDPAAGVSDGTSPTVDVTTTTDVYPLTEERAFRLPPCRNLCEEAMKNCRWLYSWGSSTDYLKLNCSDFPDSTDPEICVGGKEVNEAPVTAPCTKGYMKCDKTRCVHTRWKCDGYQDCQDKADEQDCSSCASKYKCSGGACINKQGRCNGVGECSMDSDEKNCVNLENSNAKDDVNGEGILQVYSAAKDAFLPVCADNWNDNATAMVCTQMGYSSDDASFSETNASSTIEAKLNSTDLSGKYIQGNLDFSASCPSKQAVNISCGSAKCGLRPAYIPSFARIVGGTEVRPGTWPWVVGLYGPGDYNYYCAGALINEQWVITAAHCIGGMTPKDGVSVYLGITRRKAYGQYKQVRKVIEMKKHPNFTNLDPPNDIALMKLETPVKITDYVRPVCLPPNGKDMKPGMTGYVAGWGHTVENAKTYSDVLKQVLVTLTDTLQCSATLINEHKYFKGMVQKDKSICAVGKKGFDSCQGDSGAPLVFEENGRWFAGGLVSTGIGCARALPAVYTNVANYVDWINSVINS